MKKALSICFTLILALVVVGSFQLTALAGGGGGGGGGNGSGGNKDKEDKPLTVESTSIENNASDVALDEVIKLVFSNNVVNMDVEESNRKQIKLVDASGNEVAVNIEMADDQVDREKRNDVLVSAKDGFKEGTTYKLIVDKSFEAKNGSKMAEPYEIEFTTTGGDAAGSSSIILYSVIGAVLLLIIIVLVIKRKPAQS